MEYLVLLKQPFGGTALRYQVLGQVATGFGGWALLGWRPGAADLPAPTAVPGFGLSRPFTALAGLSTPRPPLYENQDFALYLKSARGGDQTDYYEVGERTLVHDRPTRFTYWQTQPDPLEVTARQLKDICPPASLTNIERHIAPLNAAMRKYGIDSRLRQAHFLVQVSVESDHFRTTREYASGSDYEGRADLGNTQRGDGVRFRGRGLIQLTGRDVYTQYGRYLARDLTTGDNPQLVEAEPLASDSAGWFWKIYKQSKDLNGRADRDNVESVTRAVNGGTNGLANRRLYLANAKRVFSL